MDLEFHFKAEWDATEESDLDLKVTTVNGVTSDTDTYDLNFDVVTNLVTGSIECTDGDDPDHVNVGSSVQVDFTTFYANDPSSSTATTLYPPDAEYTSISIYDSSDNNEGTDSTIVNGAGSVTFSVPTTAASDTYNLYINMADADYTDAEESTTEEIIADGLKVTGITSPSFLDNGDFSYKAQIQYAYNNTAISSGVVRIVHSNGTELTTGFTANATGWATIVMGQTNSSVAGTYTIIGHTEPSYGITDMYANQTFVLRSWTLQARDKDGTNLPRSVVFDVDVSSSAFDDWTSTTSGLSTTIYAPNATTYTVTTKWGTHTVQSSSVALSANTASNIDTKIARLDVDDAAKYLLFSLNNTDLVTPQLQGEADWLIHNTEADGEIEFKMDSTNWRRTDEPTRFIVGAKQYDRGVGTWSWSDSTFTFTDTYEGVQDISMTWAEEKPPPAGGPLPPPSEEPTTEEPPTEPPSEEPATEEPIIAPVEKKNLYLGMVSIIAIIGGVLIANQVRKRPRKKILKTGKLGKPEEIRHPKHSKPIKIEKAFSRSGNRTSTSNMKQSRRTNQPQFNNKRLSTTKTTKLTKSATPKFGKGGKTTTQSLRKKPEKRKKKWSNRAS